MPSNPSFYYNNIKLRNSLAAAAGQADRFIPLNEFAQLSAAQVLALARRGFMDEGRSDKYSLARAFKINDRGLQMLDDLRARFVERGPREKRQEFMPVKMPLKIMP